MMKMLKAAPFIVVTALAGCTTSVECAQVACEENCTIGRGADGCNTCICGGGSSSSSGGLSSSTEGGSSGTGSSRGACFPTTGSEDAGQIDPADMDGGVALSTLRGSANALSPSEDSAAGPVALVKLQALGLSNDADDVAAVQSFGGGVKLVGLNGVDAVFGTLPVELDGHAYDLGGAPGFGAKAPAIRAIPGFSSTGAGTIDVVALTAPEGAGTGSALYAASLVSRPVASSPVPGAATAGNMLTGFSSPNVALVGNRYLYVRNDTASTVEAFDLMTFTMGTGFARVESRSFAPPMLDCDVTPVLAALTPTTNSISGELAQAFTASGASGAGIYVFNPETAMGGTFFLPTAPNPGTELVDIPAVAWSADGTHLFVAYDGYSSVDFSKTQSNLLIYAFANGQLTDASSSSFGADPMLRITLGAEHPTTIFTLAGHADEVGAISAPYGDEAALEIFRFSSSGAVRIAHASLGTFAADMPSVEEVTAGGRTFLVVGTADGIQMFELVRG